jgi:hypothetical protein
MHPIARLGGRAPAVDVVARDVEGGVDVVQILEEARETFAAQLPGHDQREIEPAERDVVVDAERAHRGMDCR